MQLSWQSAYLACVSTEFTPKHHIIQAWWHRPVILAVGRWRQKYQKFKASFSYIVSPGPPWAMWDPVSTINQPPTNLNSSKGNNKKNTLS